MILEVPEVCYSRSKQSTIRPSSALGSDYCAKDLPSLRSEDFAAVQGEARGAAADPDAAKGS